MSRCFARKSYEILYCVVTMVVSSAHLSVSPCNHCPSAKPVPYNLSCYFQVLVSVLVKTQTKLLQWRPQKTPWLKCGQHLSESSQGLQGPGWGTALLYTLVWGPEVLPCGCWVVWYGVALSVWSKGCNSLVFHPQRAGRGWIGALHSLKAEMQQCFCPSPPP